MYDPPSLPSTFKYPEKKQFDLETIITNKRPVDMMTHSINPFTHNQIQIFKPIIIKILFNLTIILIC